MEFSGRDLEDIQRVAGLLGLTVDELIQKRRRQPSPTPGATSFAAATAPTRDSGPLQAAQQRQEQQQQQQEQSSDNDMPHDWGTPFPGPLAVPEAHRFEAADLAGCSPQTDDDLTGGDTPTVVQQTGDTEVILLNPQQAWFDCNHGFGDITHEILAGLSSIDVDMDVDSLPGMNDDDVDSYVRVGGSVSTPFEREDESMTDAATDWTLVSSSPGSGRRRYEPLASKPGRTSLLRGSSSSSKIRKKRSTYQPSMKRETNLTRQLNACVRCKMQRNRVSGDDL